jgi:predicted dehydrogenase
MHLPRTIFTKILILILSSLYSQAEAPAQGTGDKTTKKQMAEESQPVRLAVAGLVHGHVEGFLRQAMGRKEVQLVGVWDGDRRLTAKYAAAYHLDSSIVFANLAEMLEQARPQAVMTFTSTFDHLKIVQLCAPRGIHVMMEKPLAVSLEPAREMAALANRHKIQLMVNYETSWYGSNRLAFQMAVSEKKLGQLRKIVFHTGHQGPREIGCPEEFLAWLTDPRLNGAGALYDFGCYGANLATWLLERRPDSVTAVTQQIKPTIYPKVDDEATLILTYPGSQVIIQASWNWPFGRKDMTIYGTEGWFYAKDKENCLLNLEKQPEQSVVAAPLSPPFDDPISMVAAVAQGKAAPNALSSLENNLVVTEILEAARESAKRGKTIILPH